MALWMEGAWSEGAFGRGQGIHTVTPTLQNTQQQHAVFLDVSSNSDEALARGRQTLLINAAVMDVKYRPRHPPFVVDIDLPRAV